MERLFLGIADTNDRAFIVVGDSRGEIICTGLGGSVDYRFWGVRQVRTNLRRISEALGGNIWSRIAGVCFTYIKGHSVNQHDMRAVVSGLMGEVVVQVQDFATSAALGIHSPKERLFLMGHNLGMAILQSEGGQRHEAFWEELLWNAGWGWETDLQDAYMQGSEQRLFEWARTLDDLIAQGDSWALAVAYDVSLNLFRLVAKLGSRFSRPDPVIGLHGPLLLGSEVIRERVRYLLNLRFPEAEIIDAPLAPAKGAYLSALLTRKTGVKQEVLNTFYSSARSLTQRGWLDFVADN